jgi:glycosyltransferase involved in cell wall biosynthesis
MSQSNRVRVLYSFPHKLGADRICYTAWQQVNGLAAAGAEVLVLPGSLHRPVAHDVATFQTLAWGKLRIPYRVLGSNRAFALHDYIVSRRVEKLAGRIDIVHTWPLGALQTLRTSAKLGIPTVLERPNAHTRLAMEIVKQECEQLGVALPADHEHAYNRATLAREEEEYRWANRLLCPSDFVLRSFLDKGFDAGRLARHQYGFDENLYGPNTKRRNTKNGLTMLFAGGCAPRKGLHYALTAWFQSPAHQSGTFLIAGAFIPSYATKLSSMLSHPSIRVLGHRKDVPELMRTSDILILPSIEEGSALVTSEARGSGCVLLVSEAAGAVCTHMVNALVHRVGDTESLTRHITMLDRDRTFLEKLRSESLRTVSEITWKAAGARLLDVYRKTIAEHKAGNDARYPHTPQAVRATS